MYQNFTFPNTLLHWGLVNRLSNSLYFSHTVVRSLHWHNSSNYSRSTALIMFKYQLCRQITVCTKIGFGCLCICLFKGTVQWELRWVKLVSSIHYDILFCQQVSLTLPQGTPSREFHKRCQRHYYFLMPSRPVGPVKTTA